jgi:hypothetical protein
MKARQSTRISFLAPSFVACQNNTNTGSQYPLNTSMHSTLVIKKFLHYHVISTYLLLPDKPLLPPMHTLILSPHTPPHILLAATQSRKHRIQALLMQTRGSHNFPQAGHQFRAHGRKQAAGELEAAEGSEERIEEVTRLLARCFDGVVEVFRVS